MPQKIRAKGSATRKRADTADIVGIPRPKERIPTKWKKHYTHLKELRKHLVRRQGGLVKEAKEEQPAFSLHMADAGTDSFDRDLALSQASSEQDAVYEIDEAMDRIRERTYGICELTGKPIESARLEAIPWTRFSLAAEQMLEKNGAIRRARLGPRESFPRGVSGETGESETEDSTEAEPTERG